MSRQDYAQKQGCDPWAKRYRARKLFMDRDDRLWRLIYQYLGPEIHQPNTSNGVCPENGLRCLVNVFRNAYATVPCETITIDKAFGRIKSGYYATQIAGARRIFAKGDRKRYSATKCGLEAFIFQGIFDQRNKESLSQHSGCATLDYDHVGENTAELFTQVCRLPYVLSAFLSPSGEGVKVVVRIPIVPHAAEYERIYLALLDDLASKIEMFAVNRDKGTKDVSRLCFVSHDPMLYSNPEASTFSPQQSPYHHLQPQQHWTLWLLAGPIATYLTMPI